MDTTIFSYNSAYSGGGIQSVRHCVIFCYVYYYDIITKSHTLEAYLSIPKLCVWLFPCDTYYFFCMYIGICSENYGSVSMNMTTFLFNSADYRGGGT